MSTNTEFERFKTAITLSQYMGYGGAVGIFASFILDHQNGLLFWLSVSVLAMSLLAMIGATACYTAKLRSEYEKDED